jgi:hypothetical protein
MYDLSSGLHKGQKDTQPPTQKHDHSSDLYEGLLGERNKKEKKNHATTNLDDSEWGKGM